MTPKSVMSLPVLLCSISCVMPVCSKFAVSVRLATRSASLLRSSFASTAAWCLLVALKMQNLLPQPCRRRAFFPRGNTSLVRPRCSCVTHLITILRPPVRLLFASMLCSYRLSLAVSSLVVSMSSTLLPWTSSALVLSVAIMTCLRMVLNKRLTFRTKALQFRLCKRRGILRKHSRRNVVFSSFSMKPWANETLTPFERLLVLRSRLITPPRSLTRLDPSSKSSRKRNVAWKVLRMPSMNVTSLPSRQP
mmetsp:Transcript_11767/g.18997  ORF Transcript_11767/g.18997 Transcript_11767/m.18997 type:complete len:249 (+) Transcript_11767:457-1203(+)